MARYRASIETSVDAGAGVRVPERLLHERPSGTRALSRPRAWEPERSAQGTEFRLVAEFLGRKTPITYRIVEYDPPNAVTFVGENATAVSHDRITFQPIPAGTRVTYDAALELKGLLQARRSAPRPGLQPSRRPRTRRSARGAGASSSTESSTPRHERPCSRHRRDRVHRRHARGPAWLRRAIKCGASYETPQPPVLGRSSAPASSCTWVTQHGPTPCVAPAAEIDAAYFLIHSMGRGGPRDFAPRERAAAVGFATDGAGGGNRARHLPRRARRSPPLRSICAAAMRRRCCCAGMGRR